MNKKKVKKIIELLVEQYPEASCALEYDSIFHLLVAVVLSAQTTDKSVNIVSSALFAAYPDARAMANADPADVEDKIRRIGLYKT